MKPWDGTFEMIDPRLIVVDHTYQRDVKPELIGLIQSQPAWEAFVAVSCFKRPNGVLYAFDGQQRLMAFNGLDDRPLTIPVIWFPSTGPEYEARVFGIINSWRRALSSLQKHKSDVIAKSEVALALSRACETAGFTIGASGPPRTVAAVKALSDVYALGGEECVLQTLVCIRDAWPDDRRGVDSSILKLVGSWIAESNGLYDRKRFTKLLSTTTPESLLRRARALRHDLGGSLATNLRRALKEITKV